MLREEEAAGTTGSKGFDIALDVTGRPPTISSNTFAL